MSSVELNAEVGESWEHVLDDNNEINWMLAQYDPEGASGGASQLIMLSEGTGGMEELKANLGDQLLFGGFKCVGVDDRGNTVSRRSKFIRIAYAPSTAPVMQRARAGGHKGAVSAVLRSAHVDMQIEDAEELTEEDISSRLLASGGAHAPGRYEF